METIFGLVPSAVTIVLIAAVLYIANRVLDRQTRGLSGHRFRAQLIMVGLFAVGLLIIILVIPIGDARRSQLLSLIGIVLSAGIALSSTTVLGNVMAGVMLGAIRNVRIGDFIHAGDHFGRVTERGLFHTEIQTEERRLTTLPNLFLVTHPVNRVRASGTIVSAHVSLGYDVSRVKIEKGLLEAAEKAGLSDPFVQVRDLGDFSVTYRVAGMLTEVKRILTVRSELRCQVLDRLHTDQIEIVSPNFMNQRVLPKGQTFIPRRRAKVDVAVEQKGAIEDVVFDKAEEAVSIEAMKESEAELAKQIAELESKLKEAEDGPGKETLERTLKTHQARRESLVRRIEHRRASVKDSE
ncbi:MAG: mechanosensitive ion channel family protein [bacterium]|nr:mechanosensitive ion channel family protein [bacterium]